MNELKVKVGGDNSGFELAMAKVTGTAEHTARHIASHLGNSLAGMISIGAIEQTIHKTIAWAAELTDMSERTGVSVEQLQRLTLAAKENGTSLDSLVGFWDRIARARSKALANPGGSVAKAFGKVGVSDEAMRSGSPDDIVRHISAAFQKTENVDELLAPLQEIGGKGAGKMIALLRSGYDQQYQDLQVMTGAQADVLKELEDKWTALGQKTMAGVAPVLVKLIDLWGVLQDKLTSFFTALMIEGDAMREGKTQEEVDNAGREAFAQSERENEAQRKAEEEAREKKVKERLKFGKVDFGDDVDTKKQKMNKITELQLDSLSKAGLFAGGAGNGRLNNIPEQTLEATKQVVENTQAMVDAMEEAF